LVHVIAIQETAMTQSSTLRHAAEHDRHLEAHLSAFNAAFAELGLRFRWDMQTLYSLAVIEGERARISAYIDAHHSHLLKAYSSEFLCEAILALKHARLPGDWLAGRMASQGTARETPAMQAGWEGGWQDTGAGLPALSGA
jgi:transcriptional regulator of met regulon